MKYLEMIAVIAFLVLMAPAMAEAEGPFGPPQPVVKGSGGLHTAIGYWFHENQYVDGTDNVTRQNQIYSELGYGWGNGWEITARVGMSDFKLSDAFGSSSGVTTTSKPDFQDNGEFFTTVGAKGFYPFSETFGMGAFVQGTYYFSDFADDVSGNRGGVPFTVGLRVKNLWNVNFGMGLQVTAPGEIKFYIGPSLHYSEFKVTPGANIAGLALTAEETVFRNKTGFGGFAGIEVPLAKGFRLNLEGQYAGRPSAGAAVIYAY